MPAAPLAHRFDDLLLVAGGEPFLRRDENSAFGRHGDCTGRAAGDSPERGFGQLVQVRRAAMPQTLVVLQRMISLRDPVPLLCRLLFELLTLGSELLGS